MRILLIEDDYRLSQALKKSLVEEGYAVDAVYDGVEGEAYAESTPYDAMILDILLPRKDGIAVCRTLCQHHITTPILMLTARDAIEDRVQGLDSGPMIIWLSPLPYMNCWLACAHCSDVPRCTKAECWWWGRWS